MRTRTLVLVALVIVTTGAVMVVVFPGESKNRPAPDSRTAASVPSTRVSSPSTRFRGEREKCSTRSEASFPGAFTSSRNLVIGPLVFVGGAYTDPGTVREFGGNKFPVLVKAGHTVTVRLPREARRFAGLAYGRLPQGEVTLRDAHRSVTFIACRPGAPTRRYSPNGPSGSFADGVSVTFWSGFVLTRTPACIPLDVYLGEAATPRRVELPLGRRCAE